MHRRLYATTLVAALIAVALTPAVPANDWIEPLDTLKHDACQDRDGLPFDQTRCQVLRETQEFYECSLEKAKQLDDDTKDQANRTTNETWPTVQRVKCRLMNGVDENIRWWNNEAQNWTDSWWCWTWGGEAMCPQAPRNSMLFWLLDTVFGCPQEWDCPDDPPEAPPLLPPKPPYP